MKKLDINKLTGLNLKMAALHALQAGLILLLSTNFSLPVIGNYLDFNEATQTLFPASKTLFSISLPMLIASFLLISSLAHLFIGTVYNKKYKAGLKKGINKARWIEYSISASVMMVAISMLVGIYDVMALTLIFITTAVMNLCGLVMEVHNQTTEKTNWVSYLVGCLSGIGPWLVVIIGFMLSASEGAKPPTFVYWIFVSIFAFFNCFALNMVLQYRKKGKWADYLYGEKVYIYLSLFAKSALAWQVFAGTLRP
jgi:Heliorhodopsin